MSKLSRDKGARGEREVADLLRPIYPEVRRRVAGEESQLVDQGRDIAGTPGLCVQVNLSKAPRIEKKVKEAIAAADSEIEYAVAFTRRCALGQSEPWLVTMTAADFVHLLGASMGVAT